MNKMNLTQGKWLEVHKTGKNER